ncbi:MAG: LysR family transcriptional regulator, partial [Pseudomonadota bacterium]
MPRGLPPLTWFRAFEAAARHLNFTSAADELGLTQSAISQHVRSLEMRLGVQLFRRNPRGLSLTDDGRRLAPQVGSAIAMLASAAASYDAGPSERLLTVATSVSIAQWILAPHLS